MDARRLSQLSPTEAAAEWLLAVDEGLTAADAAMLDAWLEERPGNAAAWAHARGVWAELDLDPDPLLSSLLEEARSLRPSFWTSLPAAAVALAASILLCVGIAFHPGIWSHHDRSPEIASSGDATILSAGMRRATFNLADGSSVLLDADSRIGVRLGSSERQIALLDGQAFFTVAHDRARPFIVTAAGHHVIATGTAFATSVSGTTVSVILTEGRVRITGRQPDVLLLPNQEYRVSGDHRATVRRINPSSALAWRAGYLEFDGVPLAEAVAEMNRYARSRLSVADAQARAITVTGRFRNDDAGRFATTLAEMFSLNIGRRPDGGLELRSKDDLH